MNLIGAGSELSLHCVEAMQCADTLHRLLLFDFK